MDQPTTRSAELDQFLGTEAPSNRSRMLKWGAIAVVILIVLLIAAKLLFGRAATVSYATEAVRSGNLTVSVTATGNIAPTHQVSVGSEESGLVTDVYVQNNDRVVKGQPLARLDTSRFKDALTQAQAQLAAAHATVAQNEATAAQDKATLARYEQVAKLSGGKVPSQTELDTARADYARAVANVSAAKAAVLEQQANVSTNQTNLSKATIYSPVTGVVISRQVEPGQTVASGLSIATLFTVAEDLSKMKLEVKVDEADVGEVRTGERATFTVDAYPGRTFPASVTRVDVGANATPTVTSTGTTSSTSTSSTGSSNTVVAYTAVLAVPNADLVLKPGMTATSAIVTAEKPNVLLVPNAALRFKPDTGAAKKSGGITGAMFRMPGGNNSKREATIGRGSRQTLYVLGADNTPEAVEVTTGQSNGSMTEVSGAGISAGTRVITGKLAQGDS